MMREFKFLYTTDDNSKMSECVCGAPGALRLKTVHWYVNSSLYKTGEEQEKHKFKIGSNCAYWLQLDPIMYNKRSNADLPHFKLKVYHAQGLVATFFETDSEIDKGIFAFVVHPDNERNIVETYHAFKDTYNMDECINIDKYTNKTVIYINKSEFCTHVGNEDGICDDDEEVRLKFRTFIDQEKNVKFELIQCEPVEK